MKETHFPIMKREDLSEVIRTNLSLPSALSSTNRSPAPPSDDHPHGILSQASRAEEATTVRTRLPKYFNPLFRKQNIVNRALIAGMRECAVLFRGLSRELDSFVARQEEKIQDYAGELEDQKDQLRTLHRRQSEDRRQLQAMETEILKLKREREQNFNEILQVLAAMIETPGGVTEARLPESIIASPHFSKLLENIKGKNAFLDPLYLRFENLFRESRQIVRERIRIYLPYLETLDRGETAPSILDIGCGRGEWLELLGEHGYKAEGIDVNPCMIGVCKEFGLKVHQANLDNYLSKIPDNSLQLLTSFHVIEHLSFDTLVFFLREATRCLKEGGLLIFETPNAGNLQVGSHYFHLDPTHNKPIPAISLKFLMEEFGLKAVETLYLNPYPDNLHLSEESKAAAAINEHIYTARDYGIIARKDPRI